MSDKLANKGDQGFAVFSRTPLGTAVKPPLTCAAAVGRPQFPRQCSFPILRALLTPTSGASASALSKRNEKLGQRQRRRMAGRRESESICVIQTKPMGSKLDFSQTAGTGPQKLSHRSLPTLPVRAVIEQSVLNCWKEIADVDLRMDDGHRSSSSRRKKEAWFRETQRQ